MGQSLNSLLDAADSNLQCRKVVVRLDVFIVRACFDDQGVGALFQALGKLLENLAVFEYEGLQAGHDLGALLVVVLDFVKMVPEIVLEG